MEVPRGFTRCNECEGRRYVVLSQAREVESVPHSERIRDLCPSCSGSGLVPTEELREDIGALIGAMALAETQGQRVKVSVQADAVLRKVAEHIREGR